MNREKICKYHQLLADLKKIRKEVRNINVKLQSWNEEFKMITIKVKILEDHDFLQAMTTVVATKEILDKTKKPLKETDAVFKKAVKNMKKALEELEALYPDN